MELESSCGPDPGDDTVQVQLPESITALSGWGRTPVSSARVVSPLTPAEVAAAVSATNNRGMIARGLGRAYGDAAQRAGGRVIDMTRIRSIEIRENGEVIADAGATLDDLLSAMVPRGWFIPVTPGTRRVTLGGMIAADVHGKNHHHVGSFGQHVNWLDLRLADGSVIRTAPPADEFWASVGGMGLTGVIERASFAATPVQTSMVNVDTLRLADLQSVMGEMVENDHRYDYTVAWLDLTARGRRMGRGVLTRGSFASLSDLPARNGESPLEFRPQPLATMPPIIPGAALNPVTAGAFNTAWYFKAPRTRIGELQSIGAFFHPLDAVQNWNRAYGPNGFLQWQFVIPDNASELMSRVINSLVDARCLSFLTVLKRFGPGNASMLSFPMAGWTLTVDVPSHGRFSELLHRLDREIVDAGGRLYFAKDSRMHSELVPLMYPRLDEFRDVCNRLDPCGRFASDLSIRLGIKADTVAK